MKTIGKSTLLGVMARKVAVGAYDPAPAITAPGLIEVTIYRTANENLNLANYIICLSQLSVPWDESLAVGGLGAEVPGEFLAPFAQRLITGARDWNAKQIGRALEKSMPGLKLTWEKE